MKYEREGKKGKNKTAQLATTPAYALVVPSHTPLTDEQLLLNCFRSFLQCHSLDAILEERASTPPFTPASATYCRVINREKSKTSDTRRPSGRPRAARYDTLGDEATFRGKRSVGGPPPPPTDAGARPQLMQTRV